MKCNSGCCTCSFRLLILNLLSFFKETDFVCFDTGFSGFESYDLDSLLASSPEVKDGENEATSAESEEIEETLPSTDEATDSETQSEQLNNFEDDLSENQSASTKQSHLDAELASPSTHEIEHKSVVISDVNKRPGEETKDAQTNSVESAHNSVISEGNETKDIPEGLTKETLADMNVASEMEPENELDIFVNETVISDNKTDVTEEVSASSSEHAQIRDLKTALGTTFDAVVTDDEITKSVTPYEEEESESLEDPSEVEDDNVVGTPLLTFAEEAASDKLAKEESLPVTSDDQQEGEKEKNMWTSLGDAVFSVVTGGERTASDIGSEEDDEDDDEEEHAASKKQKRSYGAEEEVSDPAPTELEEEPAHTEPVIQQPLFKSVPQDDKEAYIESETLSFDGADGRDKEVIVDEEAMEENVKPTETSTSSVPPPSDLDSSAVPLTEQTDLREAEEPAQHEEGPIDSDPSIDRVAIQDGGATMKNREDLDSDLAEDQIVNNRELASSEAHTEQSTEKMHLDNLKVQDEEIVMENIPDQVHGSVADFESNTSKAEFSKEKPVTYMELVQEKPEDEKDAHIEQEGKEELLEDENALPLTQSNDTDPEEPGTETASPTVSPPVPLYSDSVLRLTLLRDHFTEKQMEQVQKLLGLKNLFKVEAMFSDLEIELQATRHSHTGAAQDIESALESILEASENTILDEIEKMLDSKGAKHNDEQLPDLSSSDVETEILDDFQELAFSLRQKYSTASDSAPLTAEEGIDIDPGGFVMILL